MKIDEINSMSLDDLWSLHEKLNSMLSKRLPEEKKRLERRIQQLNGADASFTHGRRPYRPVPPK
jgi:DNA-binding protein H-NS